MSQDDFFSHLPPATAAALRRAGFASAMDLLLHFPRRHEDWLNSTPISAFRSGETVLIEGGIIEARTMPTHRGQQLLVRLQDADGNLIGLRFFRVTPGLRASMYVGRQLRARGAVRMVRGGWEMAHPKLQSLTIEGAVEAIYPAIKGVSMAKVRGLIAKALATADLSATIPPQDEFAGGDWTVKDALAAVHAPSSADGGQLPPEDHLAWRRLRFEELLAHQIVLRWRYHRRGGVAAAELSTAAGWDEQFNAALPFSLTKAQTRACQQITADLARPRPMRRLLQGDVGSGKTVVAAYACLLAIKCGYTAAFMAPTEILAEQHHQALSKLYETSRVPCELLTSSIKGRRREEVLRRLEFGISNFVVGTHALFQDDITIPRLAMAIIDEQHRFGVAQRQAFTHKGVHSHQLMMSATPIPRTLAMSIFADMDVSILDEKPAGRKPVKTVLIDMARREEVLARVAAHVERGGRVYWVCPLIEESETVDYGDVQSLAALAEAQHPTMGVRILHGRMKSVEKKAVMDDFRAGKFGLMVATIVVEVGVDVPQADVMVIERGDRMGLSQLHQLRGRVGRGERGGVCLILYQSPLAENTQHRLCVIRDTDDGFEIARQDLVMRGPGEWLGSRQSGLPMLRVAKLVEDTDISTAARRVADDMLQNDKRACVRHVRRWLGGKLSQQQAGTTGGD